MTDSTVVASESEEREAVESPAQAEPVTEPASEAEGKPAGADSEAEKPDELATWKSYARKHEDRAKAVSAELEAVKAELAEAAKGAGRVGELEAAVAAAEKRAERAEIAAEVASVKGVKLRYLVGDTREELEASADEFLADARSASKVGVVPTQGTGDVAPRPSSFEAGAARAREHTHK